MQANEPRCMTCHGTENLGSCVYCLGCWCHACYSKSLDEGKGYHCRNYREWPYGDEPRQVKFQREAEERDRYYGSGP